MELVARMVNNCRSGCGDLDAQLAIVDQVQAMAHERGTFFLEVPRSWCDALEEYERARCLYPPAETEAHRDPHSPLRWTYFPVISAGIRELRRLWSAGDRPAFFSLAYALHLLPDLACQGRPLNAELYQFELRIAAFRWHALSPEIRAMLCDLANVDIAQVEALLDEPEFVIDMFGFANAEAADDGGET
ncbi:hypothetical protein [Nannocystis pusilla]|uniref:Phospholipase C/D domain-containing protein n=1 Tax=Nannocystis pusilla TaxID=889268 RepID=A0ABS7TWI9_9BACT|nr:hypothetical protein [Nannocystis pusilla]MBZ5712620.1 hypothetical protein [Nannocystis pusilla]